MALKLTLGMVSFDIGCPSARCGRTTRDSSDSLVKATAATARKAQPARRTQRCRRFAGSLEGPAGEGAAVSAGGSGGDGALEFGIVVSVMRIRGAGSARDDALGEGRGPGGPRPTTGRGL